MPEGHTLHRLARELEATFGGRRVASSSPQGRFSQAAELDGRLLRSAEAWGKHLLIGFSSTNLRVHVHLGLYGSWRFAAADAPIVGEVRWRLATRRATADLRGPAACEVLDPAQVDALLARLGPDPLRDDADVEAFISAVRRSRAPIGVLLMDQRVLAGVGNVYRAEVLFRAGLDPLIEGRAVDETMARHLWDDLTALMRLGVERGRIDTVRPEHEPDVMGRPPRDDDHGGEVYVYRRAGQECWVCGSTVLTSVLRARNVFWCPQCQSRT